MQLLLLIASLFTFVEFNCENLFDCEHDSLKNDYEFLPASQRHWDSHKYWLKVNSVARAVLSCGEQNGNEWALPDMVALCEVENDSVIRDLARRSLLRKAGYEYIVTHLKENMSIPDLADRFFMDRNTLMRHFRHEVGMTPGECIRWHRLESARLMLLDGASAQEACADSGFSDYSAFYRAFKQAYDMSPRDYVSSHTNSRGLSRSAQRDEGGII